MSAPELMERAPCAAAQPHLAAPSAGCRCGTWLTRLEQRRQRRAGPSKHLTAPSSARAEQTATSAAASAPARVPRTCCAGTSTWSPAAGPTRPQGDATFQLRQRTHLRDDDFKLGGLNDLQCRMSTASSVCIYWERGLLRLRTCKPSNQI